MAVVVYQQQQMRPQRDGQKKRKQTPGAADEPESKMGKTEMAGDRSANGIKPQFMCVSVTSCPSVVFKSVL